VRRYLLRTFPWPGKLLSGQYSVRIGAGVLLLVILAGSGYFGWRVLQTVDHAERALHAVHLMARVTEDYLVQHDGHWPTSWHDLESISPREGGMFWWPRDSSVIQTYVHIQFGRTTAELLVKNPNDFRAISPIGPCYEGYQEAFVPLLRTMREAILGKTEEE
jgi:hypothetical protein